MIKLILESQTQLRNCELNNFASAGKQLRFYRSFVASRQPTTLLECFICGFDNVVLSIYLSGRSVRLLNSMLSLTARGTKDIILKSQ